MPADLATAPDPAIDSPPNQVQESIPIKPVSKHGGPRPGSGRKPRRAALLAAITAGCSTRSAADAVGIPKSTAFDIAQRHEAELLPIRNDLIKRAHRIAVKGFERVEQTISTASCMQAATASGIVIDKVGVLQGTEAARLSAGPNVAIQVNLNQTPDHDRQATLARMIQILCPATTTPDVDSNGVSIIHPTPEPDGTNETKVKTVDIELDKQIPAETDATGKAK